MKYLASWLSDVSLQTQRQSGSFDYKNALLVDIPNVVCVVEAVMCFSF